MRIPAFPFTPTDWSQVEKTLHPGQSGLATWQTCYLGDIRVRLVEYSPGYRADHWCAKGHVVYCVAGEMQSEQRDGETFTVSAGMTYIAGDGDPPHRSFTRTGAVLFIVD
jgi:hypothetical protein